ncbi:unnamed protein product [Lactuca virosa]|uniref:Glycosyl hydrolase family 38 C-terminal domain-containing protein n=1 Tax=Lactuca virosa TaxID=75947 RepID=A0AAU9NRK3_9ASTR|nr:unnamed protein product [Lactuca virosa]
MGEGKGSSLVHLLVIILFLVAFGFAIAAVALYFLFLSSKFELFMLISSVEGAMEHSYSYYSGYNVIDQASGAYIFHPNATFPIKSQGQIGPIPIDDGVVKEITTQITSALKTNKTFYTDSNRKDFIKRVRDFRTDWELQMNEPVAGNYYPMLIMKIRWQFRCPFCEEQDRKLGTKKRSQVYSEVLSLIELCRVQLKVVQLTGEPSFSEMVTALSGPPRIFVSTPACVQRCLSSGVLQAKSVHDSL